jgi:uncharacterized protein (DUF697 family)
MELYYGKRNIDCITVTTVASINGKYFDFDKTNFSGTLTLYRVWYDVNNTGVAPSAGGRTLVEVDLDATPTIAEVVTASAAALTALPGVSVRSNTTMFEIINTHMGAVTAAVDGTTGWTFESVAVGVKEGLGGTDGAVEVSFEKETVAINADQKGAILLGELISSVSCSVSCTILEMTAARWKTLMGNVVGGTLTPGGGTEIVGLGEAAIGRNLVNVSRELILKPVNSGSDNTRNLTLYKTAVQPESISFSGTEKSSMSVTFNAYLDTNKNTNINLFGFGNSFQDIEA